MKILAIALLCFGWYDGSQPATSPKNVSTKTQTSATYRHYRGYNELKIKDSYGKRTFRWNGPPQHGWLKNPYVK